jgi:hypothetical protein
MYVCMDVFMYVCAYVHAQDNVTEATILCMYVCMYACMHVCMYVFMYVHAQDNVTEAVTTCMHAYLCVIRLLHTYAYACI